MKTRLWLTVWCLLIAVCIGAGIFTRMSFTDFGADMERVMETPYRFYTFEAEEKEPYDNMQGEPQEFWKPEFSYLCDQSDLIVKAVFHGKRELDNMAFRDEMEVREVFKGDPSLKGGHIEVFEEIELYRQDGEYGPDAAIQEAVPYIHYAGYGLMQEETEYILFLKYKGWGKGDGIDDASNQYGFIVVPYYCRINLDACRDYKGEYRLPEEGQIVSLKDSLQYDVFILNKQRMDEYYAYAKEIVNQLENGALVS